MAFLTDRTFASGVSLNDLFHIVITGDTSQNPAGSSYKATIGQYISLLPPFTGGSGNCITDFYVTNIYGCSPITIHSETNFLNTSATGILSFSQGQNSQSSGNYSHAEGKTTISSGIHSHAEGSSTTSSGPHSHSEGSGTIALGSGTHSEGFNTTSIGNYSHSEGSETISSGTSSHAEGYYSQSIGDYSHAEGGYLSGSIFSGGTSIGLGSHAEGKETISSGNTSHAEGSESISVGDSSHAEGLQTISFGSSSHSEGRETNSEGNFSHSEGYLTESIGSYSHAEGRSTQSIGIGSHSEGIGTISNGDYQHVQGQYNFTSSTQSAFIIGNGSSDLNRSNLVFAAGNEVDIYGDLLVTGTTSADTIVISSTPTTASTLDEVMVRDSSSGELKYYDFTHTNFGLFVQTGNSTTISATTSELTLIDGGIGSLTIPANFFKPGDSFRLRMGGFISAANSEDITIRVKSGAIVLGSDLISFPNTSNRNWMLDVDFTIRTIGGTGVASLVSNGFFSFNTGSDILGGGFVTINNTTFDTTISNTLDVTAQWGSTNASNAIYSVNFVLTKTF